MYAVIYTGMNDKGIRLELYNHRVNDGAYYKLKYIITLGRYRKNDNYLELLDLWYVQILLHAIIILNSYFLIGGEKYYNEDVGVE